MRFQMRLTEKIISACALFSFLGLLPCPASTAGADDGSPSRGLATAAKPYAVPRIESGIRVDGVLEEAVWEDALALELNFEVRPGENVPPPVRTEVLLAHDRARLYAAFRCYDPDPSEIRAHLSDRDNLGDDDWVGIVLDTFNDDRRSFDLLVNPLGVQEDFVEAASGGGGSWDAIWDSAGRITEWGYTVEMSIPFNQIRFQRTDGSQVWGFDAVRRYPRDQHYHIGTFPRDRSNNCYLCQAIKIQGFEGVTPGRNLAFSPAVTAVRTDERGDFPSGTLEKAKEEQDLGVTARWGLTPNLTLTGTLNPDFSQVEADVLLLDVNEPFALYYPERRPFFTEGADFFGTLKSVIYTRTIRDPSWGAKLTGKEAGNTVGAYVVRDDLTNLIFPGSQSSSSTSLPQESTGSVFRYKRDFGSRRTVGALLTDREGTDYFNRVFGLDGNFLLTRTDQIRVQLLGSSTRYPSEIVEVHGQPGGRFSDRFIAIEYDHESRTTGWWLDYDEAGTGFRADLGFIPMVDYRNVEGGLHYTWNAKPGSWWSSFWAGTEFNYYEDRGEHPLLRGGSLSLSYSGFGQSSCYVRAARSRETYQGREFDLTTYQVDGGFRPSGDLRVYLWTRFGDRIDYANVRAGERIVLNPYVEYHRGRHLRLSLDHALERMTVEGGRLYTANISQLTVVYQFSVRTLVRCIFQYLDYDYNRDLYTFEIDPEEEHFLSQILLSYKVNPWTVIFLGYSDDHLGSSEYDLTQRDRTFFAKLGYAWVL